MKKVFAVILSLSLLFTCVGIQPVEARQVYQKSSIKLEMDGEQIQLSKPILLVNNRSMLPMRAFFELCGAKVTWDSENRIAIAEKGSRKVAFPIDSKMIVVNGEINEIDVPAMIIGDNTYLPIRAAGESLGLGVKWLPEGLIQMGNDIISDSIVLKPYDAKSVVSSQYNRAWHKKDRQHFACLFRIVEAFPQLKDVVYDEYVTIAKEREKIEKKAYHSKRGYVLFSPEITDEFNTLQIAHDARSFLLRDILYDIKKDLNFYYKNEYQYQFLDYSPKVFTVHRSDGVSYKTTEEFEIVPAKVNNFDLQAIVNKIDNLPIPDYCLYGENIYYVNGYPSYGHEAGFNKNYSYRGFFEGEITVYNRDFSLEDLMHVTLHEIGHNVGNEIFNKYNTDGNVIAKNHEIINEYASIYGISDPYKEDPQTRDYNENLAEDFANIFNGTKKRLAWEKDGKHRDKVLNFIKNKISELNYEKVCYLENFRVITGNNNMVHFRNEKANSEDVSSYETFVTNNNHIKIELDGFKAPDELQVTVFDEETDLFYIIPIEDGKCDVYLPTKGVYQITIEPPHLEGSTTFVNYIFCVAYDNYESKHYSNLPFNNSKNNDIFDGDGEIIEMIFE